MTFVVTSSAFVDITARRSGTLVTTATHAARSLNQVLTRGIRMTDLSCTSAIRFTFKASSLVAGPTAARIRPKSVQTICMLMTTVICSTFVHVNTFPSIPRPTIDANALPGAIASSFWNACTVLVTNHTITRTVGFALSPIAKVTKPAATLIRPRAVVTISVQVTVGCW